METAVAVEPLVVRERQRNRALDRANEVRVRRAAEGRKIEAAPADRAKAMFADLLVSCPAWLESEPIGRWLARLPRYGPSRIEKLLERRKISELRRIGALTIRQRRELVRALGVELDDQRFHDLLAAATVQRLPTPSEDG
ncbi:MAG TPA: hypothetical protein VG275_11115 [Solirubrobacteraceae bacterium]|jgi:hypothetical protein|nr:hypothetical protein [Solirubrobacteraceae bacterium]